MKKLYRSKKNKTIFGIIGGLGEYLETDPILLRIIFVLITMATGIIPGIFAYFISVFIVPKDLNQK